MNVTSIPAVKTQALIGFGVFAAGLWLAWQIGGKIAIDDFGTLEFGALGVAGFWVAVTILRKWRTGFYLFLVWLLFEDLVRKYLGNNMAIYFAKDILVGLVYVSFFAEVRRGREKLFRPPFLPFCGFSCGWAWCKYSIRTRPASFMALLGFKLYFYYIPLMYVSYSLIRNDEDLKKFLIANISLAGLISLIAIIQAIVGHSFLNPSTLAPEIRLLGQLDRYSPVTNQMLSLPTAVFVSAGRLAMYLVTMVILIIGTTGYLLLSTSKYRKLVFIMMGLLVGGVVFSGSRGAVSYSVISAGILVAGFLWGAPWRWRQAHKMIKAIRNTAIVGAFGFALVFSCSPRRLLLVSLSIPSR